jgi:Ca-activated chloride channel family protein
MFSFHWPWFALLLLLPFVLKRFGKPSTSKTESPEDRQSALLHPMPARLVGAFGILGVVPAGAGRLYTGLLIAIWSALLLAMMRPQWLEPYSEAKTEGYDLMLAVDASRSMGALDFSVDGREVTRMSVIKGVMGRFITAREGDRIGLIVFGDQAYVLSPLTLDVYAVRGLLDVMEPSIAGDATAIGDAIGLAAKKLRQRPKESRVLVLVTDGENTAGTLPPLDAARIAAKEGIRIYTIGVGSKGMVPFYEGGQRKMVRMEIDEDLLRTVAQLTGGAYFRAADTNALEEIYRRIDALEKTEAKARSVMIPSPLYRWPLALALLGLLLLGLFPEGRRRYLKPKSEHA